jgi:hypothetical protein
VNTVERALHVLIHDIRTPLGVAQGYLRLIREGRLPSPEDREKAFQQTQQALDLVSRLCHDAAALVERPHDAAAAVAVPAGQFAGRVRDRLQREPVDVAPDAPADRGAVAVPGDADRLADAVVRVLLSTERDRTGRHPAVAIGASDTELWFTSGPDGRALSGDVLDPWRGPGLTLPLACRTITDAGGRVWSTGPGRAGAGVALPLEVSR